MFADFVSFCSKVAGAIKRQALVLLMFGLIGGAIGIWKWSSSEVKYRQELLVEVGWAKKEVMIGINFLDASGKGVGNLEEKLNISKELASQFSKLKAENVQDTTLMQFNLRYFVSDPSFTNEIDAKLGMYLNEVEPSTEVLDTQLFEIPSSGIRSVLSFLFASLSIGIVIGMFREARSQKS
jgi:hypothetical protein